MDLQLIAFFDELQRRLDKLNESDTDNEAMRHDLIVRPLLTHPLTLGWGETEVQSQQTILDRKRPDIIIVPDDYNQAVAVIEEKKKQRNINSLKKHLCQLLNYQGLLDSVWGLLTDGERWILQKNLEPFHTFHSLVELKNNLVDLQLCIGRNILMERLKNHGTADLVIVGSILRKASFENISFGSISMTFSPDSSFKLNVGWPEDLDPWHKSYRVK